MGLFTFVFVMEPTAMCISGQVVSAGGGVCDRERRNVTGGVVLPHLHSVKGVNAFLIVWLDGYYSQCSNL